MNLLIFTHEVLSTCTHGLRVGFFEAVGAGEEVGLTLNVGVKEGSSVNESIEATILK